MINLKAELNHNAYEHYENRHSACTAHVITLDELNLCVKRLKSGKHDGNLGQYSDHLRLAPQRFLCCITMIINSMLQHGIVPQEMCLSTVSPIPKNKRKSLNDSDNYRAIALSSVIGKLLDKILITKCTGPVFLKHF